MTLQLALIPPVSMLHHLVSRELQMCLPEGLDNSEMYRQTYKYLGTHPGCYVILDNGMFESGEYMGDFDLLQYAKEYKVDEIVMPDVRGRSEDTLEAQRHFMRIFHRAYGMTPPSKTPNLMSVIQGHTVREAEEHVLKVADSWACEMVRGRYGKVVFGIPRRMSEDTGERSGRIDLVEMIASHYGPMFPIHLLGLSRSNPRELQYIAREFGEFVRGIDTDAPFVWTAEKKHLDADDTAERQEDYLSMEASHFPGPLVRHNIDTLEKWCRGE
jgi:hypothetical protein